MGERVLRASDSGPSPGCEVREPAPASVLFSSSRASRCGVAVALRTIDEPIDDDAVEFDSTAR